MGKVRGLQWSIATLRFDANSTYIDCRMKTIVDVNASTGRRATVFQR